MIFHWRLLEKKVKTTLAQFYFDVTICLHKQGALRCFCTLDLRRPYKLERVWKTSEPTAHFNTHDAAIYDTHRHGTFRCIVLIIAESLELIAARTMIMSRKFVKRFQILKSCRLLKLIMVAICSMYITIEQLSRLVLCSGVSRRLW